MNNYLEELISSIICLIHILIILCIFIIPFLNSNYLLFLYCLIIPMIQMHWLLNDDTCALTELEKFIRKDKDKSKCFTQKLFGPIYNFNNNKKYSAFSYILLNILLSICISKLVNKYENGEINEFWDLYEI